MFERKSDRVRQYVSSGEYKKALRIAKDFRLGIDSDQSEQMKIGYECMIHREFYAMIGINTDLAVQRAITIVKKLYGKKTS